MSLEELAREHFKKASEIQQLQNQKKEIDREIFNEIVETKQFGLVTINWKSLHRFAFGSPGKKG